MIQEKYPWMRGGKRIYFSLPSFKTRFKDVIQNTFVPKTQDLENYGVSKRLVNVFSFRTTILLVFLTMPRICLAQLLLRTSGGLKGGYQWRRLLEARRLLKSNLKKASGPEIKRIIEFGSGCSTLLFNSLVKAPNEFISLEEDPIWRERVLFAAQILKLRNHHLLQKRLVADTRMESVIHGIPSCHFKSTLEMKTHFTFAYVDGPTAWIQQPRHENIPKYDSYGGYLPNSDVLLLHSTPDVIVIDGRRATLRFLIESSKFLDFVFSPASRFNILFGLRFSAYHYHSILRRP